MYSVSFLMSARFALIVTVELLIPVLWMMAFLFGVVENVLIVDAGSLLMKNMRKLL